MLALRLLMLDEVWWMVTPQNPLKAAAGMAPFEERIAGARRLARHPSIRVTDIERRLGTTYTADSLARLKQCFPKTRFVWVMGADNLAQIPQWQDWTRIFNLVPVAVFDRAPYSFGALAGKAAKAFFRFKKQRVHACHLAGLGTPSWMFFHTRLHPGSSTEIRSLRGAPRRRHDAAPTRPEPDREEADH